MSSWTPTNVPFRLRVDQASPHLNTVVSCVPRADQPSKPAVESGPGPPVSNTPEPQTSQMPELPKNPVPRLPQLPPLPPSLSPLPRPVIQGFQAINAIEVIDLTGLSVDGDEENGEWVDVPEVIDLTNLPSDDDDADDGHADAKGQDGTVQNYTILNLPARSRYTLIDRPPVAAPLRPRRHARGTVRTLPQVSARAAAARVPVRRDICELCARVVRWGPGCLITKHHLYPQEITKKYADRYTMAQKNSLALLCRPCHDACHRTHDNRTLADFYYEVNLLKADPKIQAHIRSMQRATTPELIRVHGDGVSVLRGRKYLKRVARAAAKAAARAEEQNKAAGRPRLTEANLRALNAQPPPAVRRSARLTGATLRVREPTPPPGARRSARLLSKRMGDRHEVPVIVIDDDDDDDDEIIQDAAVHEKKPTESQNEKVKDTAIHESPMDEENLEVQNAVSLGDLLDLAARGEYISL